MAGVSAKPYWQDNIDIWDRSMQNISSHLYDVYIHEKILRSSASDQPGLYPCDGFGQRGTAFSSRKVQPEFTPEALSPPISRGRFFFVRDMDTFLVFPALLNPVQPEQRIDKHAMRQKTRFLSLLALSFISIP